MSDDSIRSVGGLGEGRGDGGGGRGIGWAGGYRDREVFVPKITCVSEVRFCNSVSGYTCHGRT